MANGRGNAPRIVYNDDRINFFYGWDDLGAEDLET